MTDHLVISFIRTRLVAASHLSMAHSLLPPLPASPSLFSATTQSTKNNDSRTWFLNAQCNCHQVHSAVQFDKDSSQFTHRRAFMHGLIGAGIGWPLSIQKADAKRPPPPSPPPPTEKKDPSVTGLRAKLIANMKRKEAMKQEIAKLREKGKPIN